MERIIAFTMISLIILASAWVVRSAAVKKSYVILGAILAFGVVLFARTLVTVRFHPEPGFGLVRSLSGAGATFLWIWFFLLLVAYLARQMLFDQGPDLIRHPIYNSVIKSAAGFGLFLAIVTPFTWLSPVFRLLLLVAILVYGFILLLKDSVFAKIIGGITVAVIALVLLFTPTTFWTQELPGSVAGLSQVLSGGSPKPQTTPVAVAYTLTVKDAQTDLTVKCASKDACSNVVRQQKVLAQSAANHFSNKVVVRQMVGNETIGSPMVVIPNTQSDQDYGVANDPCIASDGTQGAMLPNPKSGTLQCRTLAGHTGPNF